MKYSVAITVRWEMILYFRLVYLPCRVLMLETVKAMDRSINLVKRRA